MTTLFFVTEEANNIEVKQNNQKQNKFEEQRIRNCKELNTWGLPGQKI
jgi:hypothetical protein